MKRVVIVIGFLFVLSGQAEASQLSDGIRKTWGYLFSPVNCVAEWTAKVVSASTDFVVCVLNNANPGNLIP